MRAISDKVPCVLVETTCAPTTGFPSTMRWELINSKDLDTVNNPVNELGSAHIPSDQTGLSVARKCNYTETWSQEEFDGRYMKPLMDEDGILKRYKHNAVMYAILLITELIPDRDFILWARCRLTFY